MQYKSSAFIIVMSTLLAIPFTAQSAVYPPEMPDARVDIYKTSNDVELKAWIFEPAGHQPSDQRAAIVFFFGGGWSGGSPGQFEQQAKYLAERGMVAISADYRVKSRHKTLANVAVSDARSAIRWVRTNASRLGVDPDRIAAAGGSAGGHLAAATALLPGHEIPDENPGISAAPNALVLFNPVLITAPITGFTTPPFKKIVKADRMGAAPESMSPYHHIRPDLPPTIIFHGKADKKVPYQQIEQFTKKMESAGNRCELIGYRGQDHGFFNYGRGDGSAYTDTMHRVDAFFVSLGWLSTPES